jgi:hypothetical protein
MLINHEIYKFQDINKLKITHKQILDFVSNLDKNIFSITQKAYSFKNKEIYVIKAGKGKTKIIMWSQMHGNEPVSTMALIDFMNFLQKDKNISKNFLQNCTFYFIPMLNPDGAEKFTRRNAQNIDINRDAIKLVSPEAQLLNDIILKLKPDFAFNLHDQERYYGISNSKHPTAMSFLAPAFNNQKQIDKHRQKSMQTIAFIVNSLKQKYQLPFAKYNDNFMPIAFGDNIQKKGISTILFEGGYIINDNQRQKTRTIYFDAITNALETISNIKSNPYTIEDYQAIPQNIKLKFSDIILKNITIEKNKKKYTTDISIIRDIRDNERFTDFEKKYIFWDIGDLSDKQAFRIIDCKGKTIKDKHNKIQRLKKANFLIQYCKIN